MLKNKYVTFLRRSIIIFVVLTKFMYIHNCVQCRFDCSAVYETMDRTNDAITALEMEMATLAEQASLFDVNVPDFKQLKMCRKEIKMLKV